MHKTTKDAITAILEGDDSVPAELAGFALKLLAKTGTLTPEDSAAILKRLDGKGDGIERVVRTKEATRLFGVDVKTLRNWSARGRLVPVYGGNANFRIGYTADSVRALLSGRSIGIAPGPAAVG